MSASPILASVAPEISRKISHDSGERYMSGLTITTNRISFMAFRGCSIHVIMGARLVLSNPSVYLSLLLMIRCVSAAPASTASGNNNNNIPPIAIVAIVGACLILPSAIWALLQIWQWFSAENSDSSSGFTGNQVLTALRSNNGTIGNIHGGDWSRHEVPSTLGNRNGSVSPSQEGSEEGDALLGTTDQSPSTYSSDSRDEEGLEPRGLSGRTASPYCDQQRAARASVSMTDDGTTASTASQTRMDLPSDDD